MTRAAHAVLVSLALGAACALSTTGCGLGGSSPDPDFYLLYPKPGQTFATPALRVALRRPSLPDYLDRPQIVRRAEAGRIELMENERWGGSLSKMVTGTLVENLASELPHCQVFSDGGVISAAADVWVEVDLERFEPSGSGAVVASALLAVHWKAQDAQALERVRIEETTSGYDAESTVSALSLALGRLSETIAKLIATGPPPNAPRPSTSQSALPSG